MLIMTGTGTPLGRNPFSIIRVPLARIVERPRKYLLGRGV